MSAARHSIAFYAFSPQGLTLGMRLARDMEGDLFAPDRLLRTTEEGGGACSASGPVHGDAEGLTFGEIAAREGTAGILPGQRVGSPVWPVRSFSSLSEMMEEQFHAYPAHVFIGATGIAVRAVAPYLRGKTVDPAVVVCEIHGRFVISLLSGHVGGANALTRNLAARTGGTAVITTATDSEGLPALDVLADIAHCHVADPENLKLVTAAILAGRRPLLVDPRHFLSLSAEERASLFLERETLDTSPDAMSPAPQVVVGVHAVPPRRGACGFTPARLHAGWAGAGESRRKFCCAACLMLWTRRDWSGTPCPRWRLRTLKKMTRPFGLLLLNWGFPCCFFRRMNWQACLCRILRSELRSSWDVKGSAWRKARRCFPPPGGSGRPRGRFRT